MSADSKQAFRSAFLRMERDAELADRYFATTGDRMISWRDSQALDDHVWCKKIRRRIVEDEA